jgi:citrate lyase subunit beta/citryl-CoA lyase
MNDPEFAPPIRSELSVPGGDLRKIEKALSLDADAIFLDLEDSVGFDQKDAARATVIEALTDLSWGRLQKAVRVNGLVTPWHEPDLAEVVRSAGSTLGKIVVPKVTSVEDIARVADRLSALEQEIGRVQPIRIEIQIEDAAGLMAIREIVASSERISEVTFGQGDFAAATRMPAADIGVTDEWDRVVNGDRWLFPRQTIVFAARSKGLNALNGPYAAYKDGDGFRAYCRMSRALGFDGVWCIHPNQVPIANEEFIPNEADIARAEATIAALDAGGTGAVGRDAVMIDAASVRMARSVLAIVARNQLRTTRTDEA